MTTSQLLQSSVLSLPKPQWSGDFRRFLHDIFADYLAALDQLDETDHLAALVKAEQANADLLARWVEHAVREYFRGQTERAYAQLHKGLNFAVTRIVNLFSDGPEGHATEPLYRMDKVVDQRLTRSSLFHCPFELRTKAGMRRYGTPGFPCLYLGGSLKLCQVESRIADEELPRAAIARFAPQGDVKVLDFGYRPAVLAHSAAELENQPPAAQPSQERFLVNYIVCWPLIAAASIQVQHDKDPFHPEYVVPQLITQWLVRNPDCDGVRYFSSRYRPGKATVQETANFVFPARDLDLEAGYCGKLKKMFALTEPRPWDSTTGGVDLAQEFHDNTQKLAALELDSIC